ncbi:MAG: hypothetical protein E2O39_14360 [Planctomycetota bacterium]|nr:MAG: hypothetical protein E2O39_14360 [Planctomycetota bacterium]
MLPTILLAGFGFLLLLTLIGLALIRGFRRGTNGGAPRVLSGLLLFGGTLVLGLLAMIFTAVLLAVAVVTIVVEHGPVRSIEIVRTADPDDPASSALEGLLQAGLDPRYPVHVLVEYRGDYDSVRLARWLERKTGGDVELVEETPVAGFAGRLTRLDFGLSISRRELRKLEREFEREVPLLDFPRGFRVQFRDATVATY